ncbi:MAG: RDD family protein [Deltaproteobacteria bacterium]|nr:MAG: RDD family protein [Deltaproteobacteria bacterium]
MDRRSAAASGRPADAPTADRRSLGDSADRPPVAGLVGPRRLRPFRSAGPRAATPVVQWRPCEELALSTDPSQTPDAEPADPYRAALYAADNHGVPNHLSRLLAAFLDFVVIFLPIAMIFLASLIVLAAGTGEDSEGDELVRLLIMVFQVGALGLQVLYGAVFESSPWQATPGKKLMGLKVVRSDGSRPGFGTALGRNVAKWVSLNFCWLLGIVVLLDDEARGIWDRVVSTRVVAD